MKAFTLRIAVAALAIATAAGVAPPAMAGGYHGGGGGWHGGGSGWHGGGSGWHGGGWHGGGWHHGGYCCSSSAGWWIGGALALGAAGAIIAANSGPSVVYTTPVYAAPPVVYGAPVYGAPVYAAPPVAYTSPPVYAPPPAPTGNLIAYPARGQTQAQQTRDRSECQGWAMNQSGYDPAHPNEWTTGVMVDSYNRAMSACMTGRGYSVS
ncbi:hypothetical protein AKI39_20300 [Bordetella sp. H567]|uniref:hypothetical protein n=1 Tax=Bordetella sp. H567 TaxID=1697043 RepID=UPI00081C7FE5|nr:hypothetical protein [Bordetella sp. H567]AOB33885.1 hypothetical protein AKI39_20300 [Bordetella sp. H567]